MVRTGKEYRFAVVGSGPAGVCIAAMLLPSVPNCRVDVFDRHPHPYGLIRTGVCPDHPAMKRITDDYAGIFEQYHDRCAFFGNVWVGEIDKNSHDYGLAKAHLSKEGSSSVSVQQLRDRYSAVVLAHGAADDKLLGLKHELTAHGILPARRVVNWYNGSLDDDLDTERDFNIRNSKDLLIIGNGNIACDIVRALSKDPREFE